MISLIAKEKHLFKQITPGFFLEDNLIIYLLTSLFIFEAGSSYVACAGLELIMQPRVA
jgi:hypothetical protein